MLQCGLAPRGYLCHPGLWGSGCLSQTCNCTEPSTRMRVTGPLRERANTEEVFGEGHTSYWRTEKASQSSGHEIRSIKWGFNRQGHGIPGGQNCNGPGPCTLEPGWVTVRGPKDRESWRDSMGSHQAWALAFWLGVPSTDLKTQSGNRFVNTDRCH